MRYDKTVYFRKIIPGEYDPETGNYADDKVLELPRNASVDNTSLQAMTLVFGRFKQGSITVQLQQRFDKPFDNIRYGSKIYEVASEMILNTKHVLVLQEVL